MKIKLITALTETLRRRRNMNATVDALSRLNDRDLRDIGIHRSQIETVARGVIDFHRSVRDVTERTQDDTDTDQSSS